MAEPGRRRTSSPLSSRQLCVEARSAETRSDGRLRRETIEKGEAGLANGGACFAFTLAPTSPPRNPQIAMKKLAPERISTVRLHHRLEVDIEVAARGTVLMLRLFWADTQQRSSWKYPVLLDPIAVEDFIRELRRAAEIARLAKDQT
jgi:hypothetical protein